MGARERFTIRQDPRWPDAHIRLQKLFRERKPPDMSQERFGAEYGLGSQGMVWQYLNGYTPLNIEAAAKFAHGLRCTIRDISPEMDREMRRHILPALGLAAWGRTVALAFLFVLMCQTPERAEATILQYANYTHTHVQLHDLIYIIRNLWRRFVRFFLIPIPCC